MFTKAIVKTPCRNLINGISAAGLGKPDYPLALKQHAAYVEALETCGLVVNILEPDETFPDSTFVEDTCLVTPGCAVVTRPGALSRRNEIIAIKAAVKALGLPVEEIKAPGTLDAGDVMMVQNHYYVGLSNRTNADGARQLETILNRYRMTASTITLESVLHLKTGISYLENNRLLAFGEFLTKPELSGFEIIPVPADEAYAANSVWINGRVLMPKGYTRTQKQIENAGYETLVVDVSEFRKLDGGLSCLSLRF
jgi:dimethylargininase